jgi:WD40 repeat protein
LGGIFFSVLNHSHLLCSICYVVPLVHVLRQLRDLFGPDAVSHELANPDGLRASAGKTVPDPLGATAPDDFASSVAFSPDDQQQASASQDKTVESWDTVSGAHTKTATPRDQGRLEEAEEMEVEAMDTRKRVLEAGHPDTQTKTR